MTESASSQTALRKFRFGAGGEGNKEERGVRRFIALAQGAEEMGYDVFSMPDHLGDMVGPLAGLGALTQSTSNIRLGTSVLSNAFRHPAVLAKELATIDQLSRGRLEIGIGAGMNRDYDKVGIPFDTAAKRFARFQENFAVLDGLLRGQEFSFEGEYYSIDKHVSSPRPRQGPRPPIMIGAGGKHMLEFAAHNADIVSVAVPSTPDGRMVLSEMTIEKTIDRVDIVRKAAGDRFSELELQWLLAFIVITDDRERMAKTALEAMDRQIGDISKMVVVDRKLTVDDLLNSPYLAIGTFDQIAEHVTKIRELTQMSYVGVFPTQMENFAPVVSMLKGS